MGNGDFYCADWRNWPREVPSSCELLPVIGTIVSTWALFRCKGLTMRCVMWFSTCCWVIHNFWAGSIGGTMIEGSFLLMNGLNIIRFWRMRKGELIRLK